MMNTRIDIATFIKAYAASEEIGGQYFEYAEKWQNAYNIVEAYYLCEGDLSQFSSGLAQSIKKYGIEHFRYQEEKYARKAYWALTNLDREYSLKYGEHFKECTKGDTDAGRVAFLVAFDKAYNAYMAGGHIDYEDR